MQERTGTYCGSIQSESERPQMDVQWPDVQSKQNGYKIHYVNLIIQIEIDSLMGRTNPISVLFSPLARIHLKFIIVVLVLPTAFKCKN